MKCWNCEHFKIQCEPLGKISTGLWDFGRAKCMKHNLVVDFPNHGKLKKLECVEEVKPELVSDLKGANETITEEKDESLQYD